jgi:hypothetical protein
MEVLHRIATDVFCLLTLIFLRSWNLPPSRFSQRVVSRLARTVHWLGLSHTWSMFAPKPISHNEVLRFRLMHADGTFKEVIPTFFPTMEGIPAICDVRHLKVMHSLSVDGNSAFKDSFARYLLTYLVPPQEARQVTQVEFLLVRQEEPQWQPSVRLGEQLFERTVYVYRPHA